MKEKQNKEVNIALQLLKRKGLVAFASLGLLISLIFMGTTAWYTRINDVSGISLNVAQFEFQANQTTNEFTLNTADYFAVDDNLCAPGTVGVIPVVVTNKGQTAVTYSLGIDESGMADEFKARIRFFYFDSSDPETEVTLNPGETVSQTFNASAGDITEYIYWEWVYELDENKFFDFDSQKWVINGQVNQTDDDGNLVISDGKVQQVASGVTLGSLYVNYNIENSNYTGYPEQSSTVAIAKEKFDDFDYKVGTGYFDQVFTSSGIIKNGNTTSAYIKTEKYMSSSSVTYTYDGGGDAQYSSTTSTVTAVQLAMQSKIIISGVQANPSTNTAIVSHSGLGKTTYRAISSFTSGIAAE